MIKLIHCPFCGSEYFLFGKSEAYNPESRVTCPDCGTITRLSRLEKYRHLTAQKGAQR